MDENLINEYLESLYHKLRNPHNWKSITLSRDWTRQAPDSAGVYILISEGEIVYVGETSNLRKRMSHLLNTQNHCVRRTLGNLHYSSIKGFKPASSHIKFPDHIEELLNAHIMNNIKVAYITVLLGRKELEVKINKTIPDDIKLNKRD
jgi:hypothetical protein